MMTNHRITLLVISLVAFADRATASAQGRGWRWFQSCPAPTSMVLDVRLDSASVFRTTFPICLLTDAPWSRRTVGFRFTPPRAMTWPNAFMWRGGTHVDASTNGARLFVAQIHEAGTDTAGSSLGIVIKSKDSLTLTDTIFALATHKAVPGDQVTTELVPGLSVTTYPVGWQPRPRVVSRVDTTWCARPRPNEPLLLDARFLPARGRDRPGPDSIYVNLARLPRRAGVRRVLSDSIRVVRDEAVCRRAAHLYAETIRGDLPDWPTKPVLVVQMGAFYLVDDQSSRDGTSPVWEVHVFDRNWEYVIRYGEGA